MKSIMQAILLLTISAGNTLLGIGSLLSFLIGDQVIEYLLYTVLLLLATVLFFFLTRNYQYRGDSEQQIIELQSAGEDEKEDVTDTEAPLITQTK
jgi:hypothetical protein